MLNDIHYSEGVFQSRTCDYLRAPLQRLLISGSDLCLLDPGPHPACCKQPGSYLLMAGGRKATGKAAPPTPGLL